MNSAKRVLTKMASNLQVLGEPLLHFGKATAKCGRNAMVLDANKIYFYFELLSLRAAAPPRPLASCLSWCCKSGWQQPP